MVKNPGNLFGYDLKHITLQIDGLAASNHGFLPHIDTPKSVSTGVFIVSSRTFCNFSISLIIASTRSQFAFNTIHASVA
ncbi:hypothetical protein L1887_20049 [Cichorium endivia]|nr:hypothetical protein L1887_20049 [Cichorium endivia]